MAREAEEKFTEAERFAADHYNLGDAFEGMKELRVGIAHFAEVDPPYAIELDRRKARNTKNNMRAYREVAEEDYGHFVKDVARLVYKALRTNTFCVWWYAPEWEAVVRDILEEVGFEVSVIPAIWYKGQAGQTTSPDTMLASSYEPFFVLRKGMPKLRKAGRSNVFEFSPLSPNKKIHPTERPVDLMRELLSTFCYPGSTVLSPFLGSGSVLRACYKERMVGFGWDIDELTKHRFLVRVKEDALKRPADEEDEPEEKEA